MDKQHVVSHQGNVLIATMRYHHTPTGMAKLQKKRNRKKTGKDVEKIHTLWVEMQSGKAILKNCLAMSYKIKHIPT